MCYIPRVNCRNFLPGCDEKNRGNISTIKHKKNDETKNRNSVKAF